MTLAPVRADAQSTREPVVFNLPRQPLSQSLSQFARQAGVQVLAPSEGLARLTAPALRGRDTVRGGLTRLIAGSGLEIASDDGQVVLLRFASPAGGGAATRLIDGAPALLEEVVVTALRRESAASRTPLSLIAINGEAVAHRGASSLSQLAALSIGLAQTEVNTGQRRLSLRGVQSAGENTVAFYLGETPISGPNSATSDPSSITPDLDLYDLARIEILKGPQGTLFGAGSMSGALRLLYAEPAIGVSAAEVQVSASAFDGGGEGGGLHAFANLSLGEEAAVRIVGWSQQRPGYIDNVRLGTTDGNGVETEGVRVGINWRPLHGTRLLGTVMIQDQTVHDSSVVDPSLGHRRSQAYALLPFPNRFQLYNLMLEQDTSIGRLTANAASYEWRSSKFIDTSLAALLARRDGLQCGRYNGISGACDTAQLAAYRGYIDDIMPVVGYQPMSVKSSIAEARVDSLPGRSIGWTVGAFIERRRDQSVSSTIRADAATGEPLDPLEAVFQRRSGVELTQTALFGEVALSPFPALTFRIGGRRYGYDKTSRSQVLITSYINASVAGPETLHRTTANGWVSRATASFQVNDHAMIFGQYAEGFRPGGVNNTPGLAEDLVGYTSDRVRNFELGAKTTANDGRLLLDAALYQVVWSDMQVSARVPNFNLIANAGEATIRGMEFEGQVVGGGWRARWSVNLIDARLTRVSGANRYDITGRVGDKIPYEPDVRVSASLERRWLLEGGIELTGVLEGTYLGERGSLFDRTDANYERLEASMSANLGLSLEADRWSLGLRVENAADDDGVLWVQSRPEFERGTVSKTPREFSLTFRRRW